MKKADKLRYDELCKLINHHNELYYNQDSPEIDDYEYDMLMLELKHLEHNSLLHCKLYCQIQIILPLKKHLANFALALYG